MEANPILFRDLTYIFLAAVLEAWSRGVFVCL